MNILSELKIKMFKFYRNKFSLLILLTFFTGAALSPGWKQKNNYITYDYTCLINDGESLIIGFLKMSKDIVLEDVANEVTLSDEITLGKNLKQYIESKYNFSSNKLWSDKANRILTKLCYNLTNARFGYSCYVLENEEINAFTAGGVIFINSGLMKYVKSEDELAGVIGHEIFHNELKHLKQKLAESNFYESVFGEYGEVVNSLGRVFTVSFDQQDEVASDLHGLDLAVKSGFDGCQVVSFWERMGRSRTSSPKSFEKFFSSHPYSTDRVACIKYHISENYYHPCSF